MFQLMKQRHPNHVLLHMKCHVINCTLWSEQNCCPCTHTHVYWVSEKTYKQKCFPESDLELSEWKAQLFVLLLEYFTFMMEHCINRINCSAETQDLEETTVCVCRIVHPFCQHIWKHKVVSKTRFWWLHGQLNEEFTGTKNDQLQKGPRESLCIINAPVLKLNINCANEI